MVAMAGLALAAPTAGVREVPFEIASNKPFLRVAINGSAPQWFILDTGCSETSVVAKECAGRIGLEGRAEGETHLGAGEGVRVGVSTASDVTLDVGGATMTAPELRIFPLGHVAPFEGRAVDGLIGQDFFERYVVEIDYARQRIRIHDPDRFVPPPGATSIPITIEGGHPVAAGALRVGDRRIPCRLVIDTGVRATVIFYRPFAVERGLLDVPGNLHRATIGGGAGGETRGDIGRVASLRIGGAVFQEPIALFARDTVGVFAGSEVDGIVGGELLRRQTVTFDYPHGRMLFQPYASAPAFEYDMSGLFLVARGESFQRIVILSVTRGTPAADADLRPGDEILAIDGRRSPDLTLEEARRILRTPGSRRLEVERNGRRLPMTLVARRLV